MAAIIRANNAEGGSDGTTVTVGNSGGSSGDAFSSIVGTGLTFSNLVVGAGSLSYRTANASVYAVYSGLGALTHWTLKARVYFANVSATQGVVYAKESGGDYTSLEYSGSSRLWRVRGTGGTLSGSVQLTAGTWYDIELSCAGSNTNTARIYNTSGTLLDTITFGNTVTVNLDEAWFGSFVATGVYPSYFDSFSVWNDKLDYLTPLGLQSSSQVGTPTLTVEGGGGNVELTPLGLASATATGSPAMTQDHTLEAVGLASASQVGAPSLRQDHTLEALGLLAGSAVGSPAMVQDHALTPTGLVSASQVGRPALGDGSYTWPPVVYGGAWVTPLAAYVVVNGTWKQASAVYAVKEEEWK